MQDTGIRSCAEPHRNAVRERQIHKSLTNGLRLAVASKPSDRLCFVDLAAWSSVQGLSHGLGDGLRFLITGGAGFIGSHLCDGLLSRGHHVHVLDDLSTGSI